MEIHTTYTAGSGAIRNITSNPLTSEKDFAGRDILGVRAFCFYGDQLVLVGSQGDWTIPGGRVESGENLEQALEREVHEETNMKVLRQEYIFLQVFYKEGAEAFSQTLSVCIVEPYGDFVADPDTDVTEVKLIDPSEYINYVDWGDKGVFIQRALEVKKSLIK